MGFFKKDRQSKAIAEDTLDKLLDKVTRDCYQHYYKRWRELSGVKINQRIDFKIPCIEIESKLCDPRNLKMIKNGKHTDDFLQLLSSD